MGKSDHPFALMLQTLQTVDTNMHLLHGLSVRSSNNSDLQLSQCIQDLEAIFAF